MMIVARVMNQITCSYPETYRDSTQLGEILTSLLNDIVKATGVSWDEIFVLNRKRRIVMARNLFFFIARRHLRIFTLQQIADVFTMDHSTVIHACHQIENALQLRDGESRMVQDRYLEILNLPPTPSNLEGAEYPSLTPYASRLTPISL